MMLATFLQEASEPPGGMGLFLVIILLFYAFVAYCWMQIANKTNTPNGWFAWVPILNIVLILQIAKKPVWWIILLLIPLVNLGVLGYLAFAD